MRLAEQVPGDAGEVRPHPLHGGVRIAYPEGGSGWQEAPYTDGRPAAGVLATNGLWMRYYTSQSNANRSLAGSTQSV